jgi:FolB domain-containing protein
MLHQHNQNDLSNKNTIFINDLLVNTIIGVQSWETAIQKKIYLDLTINLNNDDYNNFNHQELLNLITNFCSLQSSESLQALLNNLEQTITAAYPDILSLNINIKQPFPTSDVKTIGVGIARTYHS